MNKTYASPVRPDAETGKLMVFTYFYLLYLCMCHVKMLCQLCLKFTGCLIYRLILKYYFAGGGQYCL